MREILIDKVYHHFKGNDYKVLYIATHSETLESMIVYQALYGDYSIWVRPYDMFNGLVDKDKYPDIEQKYRFELKNKEEKKNG